MTADASAQFTRAGNKHTITPDHQRKVLDAFIAHKDDEHSACLVKNEGIAENDYNLSVTSYVDAEDTREVIDITELNAEIANIVARQAELRTAIDAIVADLEGSEQ